MSINLSEKNNFSLHKDIICIISINYVEINRIINELKTTADVNGFVIFSIEDNNLKICCEDVNSSMIIVAKTNSIEIFEKNGTGNEIDQSRVVNARCLAFKLKINVLSNLIKKLNNKNVIEIKVFTESIIISQNSSDYTLYVIRHKDDISIKEVTNNAIVIDKEIIEVALKSVSFAASKDAMDQFNGVFISINHQQLVSFATDKSRISVFKDMISNNIENNFQLFLRNKSIVQILKIFSNIIDSNIIIDKVDNEFILKTDTITYRTQLGFLEQQINYEKISTPKDDHISVTIPRSELKDILSRISIISSELNNYIYLTLYENNLEFKSYDPNTGLFKENYTINYNNEELTIKIHIKYIIDCVSSMKENNLQLIFQRTGPLIVLGENTTHCIMPIRI